MCHVQRSLLCFSSTMLYYFKKPVSAYFSVIMIIYCDIECKGCILGPLLYLKIFWGWKSAYYSFWDKELNTIFILTVLITIITDNSDCWTK